MCKIPSALLSTSEQMNRSNYTAIECPLTQLLWMRFGTRGTDMVQPATAPVIQRA